MNTSVYAKPVMPSIVLRPLLATLLLHALMIWLMTVNWESSDRDLVRIKPAPQVINATLVDIDDVLPKPKAKPKPKPAPKKPPVPRPAPVKKVEPKPAPKVVTKPTAEPKPIPAEPKVEPAPQAEPLMTPSELAELMKDELDQTIAAEETASAEEMAASYAALIQRTVMNYWSRPPSARNGMEALLTVQLVPTGDVISVTVTRGSGDPGFDRSAVNAVNRAAPFSELQNLPGSEFERTFRRFRLLFRPEDLRL